MGGTSKNLEKKVLLLSCLRKTKQKMKRRRNRVVCLRGGKTQVLQWKCIQFLLQVKMNNEIKCMFSKT